MGTLKDSRAYKIRNVYSAKVVTNKLSSSSKYVEANLDKNLDAQMDPTSAVKRANVNGKSHSGKPKAVRNTGI
ncbi:hypothetical protein DXG01_016998 [Tephrocybe rancida]|nr:hypothetical protein DXG01_016998 [Tephrocybe rancida]